MKSKLLQKKIEEKNTSSETPVNNIKETVKSENKEVELKSTIVEKEDNTLNLTAYDIVRDTEKGGNNFIAVEIKYNLKTKKASITAKSFYDKTAGLSMFMDKQNRKTLFEKNRGEKK